MMSVYKGAALLLSGGKYLSLGGVFPFFKGKLFDIIQYPSIVFVAVILIVFVTLRYLKYGRLLYAIGGNPQAAYLSGVKVKLRRFLGYTVAGGLYGLASIVLISQIGVAYPTTGDAYTLSALAAVVVGGVALTGGRGSALSIFLGVVVFGLIKNSMVIMSVNPYWREIVIGCIILVAVTFSGFASRGE
jgi:ribose/xylose/arabinose/galactoside ABC-type transport system permease subunit